MAVFTHLILEQIQDIMSQYDIQVKSFKAISQGNSNSNFQVTGQLGQYMLTLCEAQNADECMAHIDILRYLHANNFSTCKVIPTTKGPYMGHYNEKPIFLKEWIHGDIAKHVDFELMQKVGKELAVLHLIKPPASFNRKHSYGIDRFRQIQFGGPDIEFEKIVENEAKFLGESIEKPLPTGLLHGDLFTDNVIISESGEVIFIDFEEACVGPFIFDIGMAILGLCRQHENLNIDFAKALIASYHTVRPLCKAELEMIQTYTYYAAVATGVWRYRTYNHERKRPGYEFAHREMMNIAANLKNLPKESFLL